MNRTKMREALAAAVLNKTPAAARVFHERRVPFGMEELPAINIVFSEPESPDEDEMFSRTTFTVAGLLMQEEYNASDGGLGFAADVDAMLDDLLAALGCIKLQGCAAIAVRRSSMQFNAEGRGMMASAWVNVEFTTENVMY